MACIKELLLITRIEVIIIEGLTGKDGLLLYSLHGKRFREAKSEEWGFRILPARKMGQQQKIGRRGWGKGAKETLADKPLHFENLHSPPNRARDWLS